MLGLELAHRLTSWLPANGAAGLTYEYVAGGEGGESGEDSGGEDGGEDGGSGADPLSLMQQLMNTTMVCDDAAARERGRDASRRLLSACDAGGRFALLRQLVEVPAVCVARCSPLAAESLAG